VNREQLTITVPTGDLLNQLTQWIANDDAVRGRVTLVPWLIDGPPPAAALPAQLAVVPHYWLGRYDLQYLAQLPNLELVQLPSAGYEHALPFVPPGVALANGRGVHSAETAELAMGLILAMQRGLYFARDMQLRHFWANTQHTHRFPSLADRRVLILGAGSVAKALVRRLAPFEVQITVVGRSARHDAELDHANDLVEHTVIDLAANSTGLTGHIDAEVHAISELPRLLPEAEILVITVPADPSTHHLIGAAELAALPTSALVVNVARGPIIDTDALVSELQSGRLRAGLDVTDPEPLPHDHPLWTAPNTLITPHMGGNTTASDARFAVLVKRQILHLLAGEPLENVVTES